MTAKRFSKKLLTTWLERRFLDMQKANHFDQNNGWAQVQGKGEEANRLYGEWRAYEVVLRVVENGDLPGLVERSAVDAPR